jgi:polar amino acid transport system substrate-binding protein
MKLLKNIACTMFVVVGCLSVSQSSATAEEAKETIRIAAIDWCPQLCPNGENKGYVVDLVELAFEGSPYNLSIETMPWSRAIKLTQDGVTFALLSPAKAEAPELLFPDTAVGTQRMCFFTLSANTWTYEGEGSLAGVKIGIAADTSIEELNDYVKRNRDQFQFQPYNGKYILSNLRKLKHKRIDAFLFTKNTTQYEINKLGWAKDFKLAGCVSKADIYMAFSPDAAVRSKVTSMMNVFETNMKLLKQQGKIEQVLSKYGLTH